MIPLLSRPFARALLALRGALGSLIGIGSDGLPRVVAAGVNGQVLTADDTAPAGFDWTTLVVPEPDLVYEAGASTGPNGKTDTRTTSGTSYSLVAFDLIAYKLLKVTAIEVVLPPTSTCDLYVDGVLRGTETNGTGDHVATSFAMAGGGIYLQTGMHWVQLIRQSGTSAFRDANDSGGTEVQIPFSNGDWALRNRIFYGGTYSEFAYTAACRLTYIPYTLAVP